MALETELQNLGLSDKEARVYLAVLELGQDSTMNIAKKAKVNRATTYVVLGSLAEKGLVSSFEKGRGTQYIANEPQAFGGYIEMRKKQLDEKKKQFSSVLPQLKSIFNSASEKPVIRFFEGNQGLFQALKEFYTTFDSQESETVKLLYSKDLIESFITEKERQKYKEIRLGSKVKSEVIYNYSKGEIPSTPDGERIKVDETKFPISIDFEIYEDNILFSNLEEPVSSVLIKDKKIAETLKTLFSLARKGAQTEKKTE